MASPVLSRNDVVRAQYTRMVNAVRPPLRQARRGLRDGLRRVEARAVPLRASVGQRFGERSTALPVPGNRRVVVIGTIVVLVLLIGAVLYGAVRSTPTVPSSPAADVQLSPAVVITDLSDGREGRPFVLAAGTPLFPLPSADLGSYVNKPVEMQDVAVQSLVAGVGFWVGTSEIQRVFVVPRPPASEDQPSIAVPELRVGQLVNLSGYFRENPGMATSQGVTEPTAAAQLDQQMFRVEANSIRPQ